MPKAQLGGGALFRNKRKVAALTIKANIIPDSHPRAPEMSGDISFTKEAVTLLVQQFKLKTTEVSKISNQHEAKLEIAASIRVQGDGVTPYLSIWLSPPYEQPKTVADFDDDIPF
jgi:hypothetical protein